MEHIKITCECCGKSEVIVKNDIRLCNECYWIERENEIQDYFSDREDYFHMREEYENYFPETYYEPMGV